MNQLELFDREWTVADIRRVFNMPPEWRRVECVVRWRFGWLTVRWTHGTKAFFQNWESALATVFHPNNADALVRIR